MTKHAVALYIVIADDDPDDHQLIKDAVHACNRNHVVASVYNGRQLLDLLLQRGFYKNNFEKMPDLIVLDVRMPLMNGFEALEAIKKKETLKNIPVHVLTETQVPADAEKALSMGAKGYFAKPLDYEELKSLMLNICVDK